MEENTIKDPRETGVKGMSGIPSLSEQAQRMANSLMGTSPSQYKIENLQSLANMPAIEEIGNVLPNFSKYDESIHTNEELANYQQHRAQEQPWTLKAVNSLVSGAVSGLATALEDIGYILDIEGHFDSWENLDNAKDNWLSAAMRDDKEYLYNALPIYETESDTALGQFFKFSTLRGMF